jgi:hypothetical protein
LEVTNSKDRKMLSNLTAADMGAVQAQKLNLEREDNKQQKQSI